MKGSDYKKINKLEQQFHYENQPKATEKKRKLEKFLLLMIKNLHLYD